MRKKILVCAFALIGAVAYAANDDYEVTINLSCDVEVIMEYEDHHTLADIIHDVIILEDYFCGE